MQKQIHLFLFCLLTLLALFCGGKNNASNVPTITFYTDNNATTLAILEKEIKEFEQKNGIKINIITAGGQEKLYAMMAADQTPDIFYTNTVMRDQLAAEGKILDFRTIAGSDSFRQTQKQEAIDRAIALDGGWYQVISGTFTYGIYYNKKLFDESGIHYPDSAWTWDDFVTIAKQLTKDKNGDGKIDQYGVYIPYYCIDAFERMNHAEFPKHGLIAVAPNESIETFRWYRDLTAVHYVMPNVQWMESMGMETVQMLETGRIAMLMESVPHLAIYQLLTIPWDVAPIPRAIGKSPLYFRGGSGGQSISATSKYPNAAWKFLTWWSSFSQINYPNPFDNNVNFAAEWEKKMPVLRQTHFGQVWRLSERYNGGDWRTFVRYSSWTQNIFTEQLDPTFEQMLKGNASIDEYAAMIPVVNKKVLVELQKVLTNPTIKPQFKERIQAELKEVEKSVQ
jgi:multiple sugar transport system substrate-binding protein